MEGLGYGGLVFLGSLGEVQGVGGGGRASGLRHANHRGEVTLSTALYLCVFDPSGEVQGVGGGRKGGCVCVWGGGGGSESLGIYAFQTMEKVLPA